MSGSMAWNRDVVPQVFRMKRFSDTYKLLSLHTRTERGGYTHNYIVTPSIEIPGGVQNPPQQVGIHDITAAVTDDLAVNQV